MLHKYTSEIINTINDILCENNIHLSCFLGPNKIIDLKDIYVLLELFSFNKNLTMSNWEYRLNLPQLDSIILTQNLLLQIKLNLLKFDYISNIDINLQKFTAQIYLLEMDKGPEYE